MNNKLSADPVSLILGIISLVVVFLGCCCGIFSAITLIMSIIGLVLAIKSLKEYDNYPDNFSHQSKKNVVAGKILCIIGISLSTLFLLIHLYFFSFTNKDFSNEFRELIKKAQEQQNKTIDSTYNDDVEKEIIIKSDSTYIDTAKVE